MSNFAPKAVNYPRVSLDYIIGVVGFPALGAANTKRISLACISMESFGYDLIDMLGVFHPDEKKRESLCIFFCMKKMTFRIVEQKNQMSAAFPPFLLSLIHIISNLTVTLKKIKAHSS